MIKELVESGRKVTPENVIIVTKDKENNIMWLETGNENAGLKHILLRHKKDFEARGISAKEIYLTIQIMSRCFSFTVSV